MSKALEFFALRKDSLEELPPGVRKWANDFCEEKEVFGISCLVAVGDEDKAPWYGMDDGEYIEGIDKEQYDVDNYGIWSWLDENPEVVFHYRWS